MKLSVNEAKLTCLEIAILGDPGADKGGEEKSKRVEKYIWNEEKWRTARRAPGDNVLPDQFQTVAAVLGSDWCWWQQQLLIFT